jgi:hypothetical protein
MVNSIRTGFWICLRSPGRLWPPAAEQRIGTSAGGGFGMAADTKGNETTSNLSLLAAIDYRELSNTGG